MQDFYRRLPDNESQTFCCLASHPTPLRTATDGPGKQPPQNRGGSSLCPRHRQPDTNASQNACSSLPPDVRPPRNQALQSCVDRCATPRRESAPAPPPSAHLPAPSVIPDRALISDRAPISDYVPRP